MKIKLNLTAREILEKRFTVSLKGYDAREVDYTLDLIKKDYEAWKMLEEFHQKEINNLIQAKEELVKQNRILKNHVQTLQSQIQALESKGLSNIDIIKRINNLEEKGKKQK